MTEAGTASGRISAHSKNRRPGKRHMVTSQAVPAPMTGTPMPTPATSTAVLKRYIGSTVEARCVQVPLPLWVRLKRMLATGIRNRAATATDSKAQPLQDQIGRAHV